MSNSLTEHNKTEHTEATLTEAILRTWPHGGDRPRYVTAVQVNSGAGYSYSRRLDAIVFDTWPGEGLTLHGLEIKTTKADLRRELQNSGKRDAWSPHLDYFSIVAPKGIVDLKILPPKWGLFLPTDEGKLRTRRKPLSLHDEDRRDITRSMAAAFMRALVARSLSKEATASAFERGVKSQKNRSETEIKQLSGKVESIRSAIQKFEETSGVKISTWDGSRIGEAVNVVLAGGIERRIRYAGGIRALGEKIILLADELDSLKQGYDKGEN